MEFTSENDLNNSYRQMLLKFKNSKCSWDSIPCGSFSVAGLACVHPEGTGRWKKLLIVQGRAETMDKYLSLIHDLYSAGYDIYTYDHPGQGYSGSQENTGLSWIRSYDDYVTALDAVMRFYQLEDPFIISVSMGALVAVMALKRNLLPISKLVLVTPMFRVERKGLPAWLAAFICDFFELLGRITGNRRAAPLGQHPYRRPTFAGNTKTHSERRLNFYHDWYQSGRIFPIGGVTWHWLGEAYRHEPVRISAGDCRILLLEAQNDKVVDNSANAKIVRNSKGSIEIRGIRGGYHDLLNESDEIRNQTLRQIMSFLEQ